MQAPHGSLVWVIYRTYSGTHWSGNNTIAKGNLDLSSSHTEACGYLGAICVLNAILQTFLPPTDSPVYTSICFDNLRVVQRFSNTPFSIQQCLLPDWDTLNKATQVRHSIPRVIKVQHVKSHQGFDTNTLETLPLPTRLNILANAGTHQAYTDCPIFCQKSYLSSTPVALVINSCLITSNHLWQPYFVLSNPDCTAVPQCRPRVCILQYNVGTTDSVCDCYRRCMRHSQSVCCAPQHPEKTDNMKYYE